MTSPTYNILVLCTGNSARSIMTEALLNIRGQGRFKAFSAGSRPTGRVNPFAVEQVRAIGYPADTLRSKSWDEFATPGAPVMDFILTVCDNAAGESCPFWPGRPVTAHWGFEDLAAVEGDDNTKRAAFQRIFRQIEGRVQALTALPLAAMDRDAIAVALRQIGETRV